MLDHIVNSIITTLVATIVTHYIEKKWGFISKILPSDKAKV